MAETAIVCVENGKEYRTQAEAARELGVQGSQINRAVQFGGTVKGLHFIYKGGTNQMKKKRARRAVICLETGTRYEGVPAAQVALGFSSSTIYYSINTGGSVLGYHFYYADKPMPPRSFFKRLRLKIKCIETGEVYDSALDAAKALGGGRDLVKEIDKGRARGFTWSYVTADGAPIRFPDKADDYWYAELQNAERQIAELQSTLESERKEFRAYKAKVARHISALSKKLDVLRELSQEGDKQVDDH